MLGFQVKIRQYRGAQAVDSTRPVVVRFQVGSEAPVSTLSGL